MLKRLPTLFIAFLVMTAGVSAGQPAPRMPEPAWAVVDVQAAEQGGGVTGQEGGRGRAEAGRAEQPADARVPESERLHIGLAFMAAWVSDPANAELGTEKQGRVGFLVVRLSGKLTDRFRYLAEVNPVHENVPLPACGETFFFFPNEAQSIGPKVACEPDGLRRVDDYRFVGLDPIPQQGPIRQAYLEYATDSFGVRVGRFILPLGLAWQETGAFTAKDAPHIARINSEANFGAGVTWKRGAVARVEGYAFLGDGNRFHDYDYYYFLDNSLDTNSALTALVSGTAKPLPSLEIRGAYQFGYTGSKVERLPNFFASKRNDQALVASVRYTPFAAVTVFGEYARYVWGLTKTSAAMLGLDQRAVVKPGYYIGAEARHPVGRLSVGGSFVREDLSRDDSLVKYMADAGLYEASLGRRERATIVRLYLDAPGGVRVGYFYNSHSNPFPQLSAIVPVAGPSAYQATRGWAKSGIVVQFRFP